MNTKRLTRSTAIGLALAAFAAPAAGAQQDLRNADQVAPAGSESQDLRNADQVAPAAIERQDPRDAGQVLPATESQDLRSPDSVDAGVDRGTSPAVVLVDAPSPAPHDGLDWADAGIGAGGLLGIGLIALGGTLVVVRRRHAASFSSRR
jgi:hypothetical protein